MEEVGEGGLGRVGKGGVVVVVVGGAVEAVVVGGLVGRAVSAGAEGVVVGEVVAGIEGVKRVAGGVLLADFEVEEEGLAELALLLRRLVRGSGEVAGGGGGGMEGGRRAVILGERVVGLLEMVD